MANVSASASPLAENGRDGRATAGLRRRWLWTAAIYGAALASGYLLIGRYPGAAAEMWLLIAGGLAVVELVLLRRMLRFNHAPGLEAGTPWVSARLLPTFGYGTTMTLACGLLLALLAGFLFWPAPVGLWAWVPAILYTVARIVDLFDGYVARLTRHETKLGAILDIEFDGLGVLIAVLLGIQYGRVPVWYAPLAFSRQLFVAGMRLRARRGLPVYDLPPSENRRAVAGLQTGFLTVMLWPVFEPPLTRWVSALFALALLASFGRDWLVVSGALDAGSQGYQAARRAAKQWVEGRLPMAARIVGAGIGVYLFVQSAPTFAEWRATFAENVPAIWFDALLVALGAALLCYALGLLPRAAALGVIGLAFLDGGSYGADWRTHGLLLACAVIVLHTGAGNFALWQPEEIILTKRLGERG